VIPVVTGFIASIVFIILKDVLLLISKRPVGGIWGFSQETVIEVTTNIESQELRHMANGVIGYEEHPRAAETDDLEAYFCVCHRDLGSIFTLKQFKPYWPKSVR